MITRMRAALTLLTILFTCLAIALPASASVQPQAVTADNFCGNAYKTYHVPNTTYYNVDNSPPAQAYTCLNSKRLGFAVTKIDYVRGWGYPHVSSGWDWGVNPCSRRSGACYVYPVRESSVHNLTTSVSTHLAAGRYNSAYDIWFNKTDAHPGQDNGAEIMVWLAHPGITETIDYYTTLDGVKYGVTTWITHHNGTSWRYVAYISLQRRDHGTFRLGAIFTNALQHHFISAGYWLTGVDFGFELLSGGIGNAVDSFSLSGLPSSKG